MPLLVWPGLTPLPTGAIRFSLHRPEAHTVRLAADFTRWSNAPLPLQPDHDGTWSVETPPLLEGVHFYKYIVDGHWIHDPAHPMVEPDGCGGWNSVFGLGGPSLGEPGDLRVVTLNLNTYQQPQPLLKLEQVAFALAAMDVDAVALQEVGEHLSDPGQPNAGEVIRTHLQVLTGQPWEHAWRMAHLGFEVYREGVSLLAQVPLGDVREYRLSQGRLARNALAATVSCKGIALRLVTTHVAWPSGGGRREVEALLDSLRAETLARHDALLLAGGFNAEGDEPQIRLLLDEDFVDVARQTCADDPPFLTALPQVWQASSAGSSSPSPPAPLLQRGRGEETGAHQFVPTSRLDYQFLRQVPGGAELRPVACVPVFNGLTAGSVYQPRVSDHIGVLGVYRR